VHSKREAIRKLPRQVDSCKVELALRASAHDNNCVILNLGVPSTLWPSAAATANPCNLNNAAAGFKWRACGQREDQRNHLRCHELFGAPSSDLLPLSSRLLIFMRTLRADGNSAPGRAWSPASIPAAAIATCACCSFIAGQPLQLWPNAGNVRPGQTRAPLSSHTDGCAGPVA
jgi:hypothetical protein